MGMPLRFAAWGLPQIERISKPQRVYFITNQNNNNSAKAMTKPRWTRVPRKAGRRAAGTKLAVLTVSIGECQNPKIRKPMILGATEFNSKEVMVSFTRP